MYKSHGAKGRISVAPLFFTTIISSYYKTKREDDDPSARKIRATMRRSRKNEERQERQREAEEPAGKREMKTTEDGLEAILIEWSMPLVENDLV